METDIPPQPVSPSDGHILAQDTAWHLGCIRLPARENNNHPCLLCVGTGTSAEPPSALREWDWRLGTCPPNSGSSMFQINQRENEKTFSWCEILQTRRKPSQPTSDETHKNDSLDWGTESLQENLGRKSFTNRTRVWRKGGATKKPRSPSLLLFFFFGYLVPAQIPRDDWQGDALLVVFQGSNKWSLIWNNHR